MTKTATSDRAIKLRATRREFVRVYINFNLPARDIIADCSDGQWIRRAWNGVGHHGWGKWEKRTN